MTTDPTSLPGGFAGPGGPYDRHGVVIDGRNAVLLDTTEVCTVEGGRKQRPGGPPPPEGKVQAVALVLGGRVNMRTERASVLFLLDNDGAAAIITELMALFDRVGGDEGKEFVAAMMARFEKLRADGNLS